MFHPCHHPAPRARIDPIDHWCAACAAVRLFHPGPGEVQTMVLLLDHERRGLTVTAVTDPPPRDDLVAVLGRLLDAVGAASDIVSGLIAISYRPYALIEFDDELNWHVADAECAAVGLELVEWFVVDHHDVRCPRELTGQPARWRQRCASCQR